MRIGSRAQRFALLSFVPVFGWLERLVDRIQAETRQRITFKETAKFNHPGIRFFLALFAVFLAVDIYLASTHAPGIVDYVAQHRDEFISLREARLFSCETCPPATNWSAKETAVLSLPNTSQVPYQQLLTKGRAGSFWMDFDLVIPAERWRSNSWGVRFPVLNGFSRVFVNGELRSFGTDLLEVYPLDRPRSHVFVEFETAGFSRFGIQSMTPGYLGPVEELRKFNKIAQSELARFEFASLTQKTMLVIFIAIFLVFPLKPELFVFILFVAANVLFTELSHIRITSSGFFASPALLVVTTTGAAVVRSFLLFWFVLGFVRFVNKRCVGYLSIALGAVAGYAFVVWQLATHGIIRHPDQAVQFGCELIFLVGFLWVAMLAFMVLRKMKAPSRRFGWLGLFTAAMCINFVLNLYDYFFLKTLVTAEFAHHLAIGILMAIVLAADEALAQKDLMEDRKAQPKNLVDLKNRRQNTEEGITVQGYILLVDATGWSERQRKLPRELRPRFEVACFKHMFSMFADLSGTSLLQQAGDAISVSWTGLTGGDRLRKILQGTFRLIRTPMIISEAGIDHFRGSPDDVLTFKAALACGTWTEGEVSVGQLKTNYNSSVLMSFLARICGYRKETFVALVNTDEGFWETVPGFEKRTTEKNDLKHGLQLSYYVFGEDDVDLFVKGVSPVASTDVEQLEPQAIPSSFT